MKILLTGAKGQLGLEIIKQNGENGNKHQIIETDLDNLDISNEAQVNEMITREKPNIIINCAAYTNVDGCESNEKLAYKVNAIGARNLAVAANNINASIVQISTDYVFSGAFNIKKREYDILDHLSALDPLSVYGKSKAFGEQFTMNTNPRHFIIRTAWLYGDGNNFVKTMLKLASQKDELSVVGDQIGSPTSTKDLTKCIFNLIETQSYGIYHGTCEGECSWYDFAKKIFEIKNIDIKVNKVTSEEFITKARRPKYSVLENFMLNLMDLNTFRNWEDALEDYLEKE